MLLSPMRRVAVVAPHADDEVLGCGGTIARLVRESVEVHVVVVTRGCPPQFDAELVETIRRETLAAHARLGVSSHFLELPAAGLDTLPRREVNAALSSALATIAPDTLFLPFIGDIHVDHQIVFEAGMVHARPRGPGGVATILAYETLSETNWLAPGITPGFLPNTYIDISDTLEDKIAAFGEFTTQVKPRPDERSIEVIRALAILRGGTVFRRAAEAFMAIRSIA